MPLLSYSWNLYEILFIKVAFFIVYKDDTALLGWSMKKSFSLPCSSSSFKLVLENIIAEL